MKQYIDKENLLKRIGEVRIYPLDDGLEVARRVIDKMPVAEAQEVKHGKWIEDKTDGIIRCSKCGKKAPRHYYIDEQELGKYCHECGAEMDLE